MKIRLGTSVFSPAYTLVTVADFDNGDWNVLEVELYYDAQYTRCMSDDNPIGKFDAAAQLAIYGALNENDHAARQRKFADQVRMDHLGALSLT